MWGVGYLVLYGVRLLCLQVRTICARRSESFNYILCPRRGVVKLLPCTTVRRDSSSTQRLAFPECTLEAYLRVAQSSRITVMSGTPSVVSVILSNGRCSSVASALYRRLNNLGEGRREGGGTSKVRSSTLLGYRNMLTDVSVRPDFG